MRDWSKRFGVAVRQRSVRQETGKSISLEHSGEQRRNEAEEGDEGDGILEYDSSSSEDVDDESFSTFNDAAEEDGGGIPSLDREATLFAWNGLTSRKNCSLQ